MCGDKKDCLMKNQNEGRGQSGLAGSRLMWGLRHEPGQLAQNAILLSNEERLEKQAIG